MQVARTVIRIDAVAALDRSPERTLADHARVAGADEAAEWRVERELGLATLVSLELLAEVADDDGVSRVLVGRISGLTFYGGQEEANEIHAREMVSSTLDDIAGALATHGVVARPAALALVPVAITNDGDVTLRLAKGRRPSS